MTDTKTKWTQQELCDEARRLFGDDTTQWAFICPNCSDVACIADFIAIGADPQLIGQECIGRPLASLNNFHDGALADTASKSKRRGCNWAAYGFFRGPWVIVMPTEDGSTKEVPSFRLAPHRSRGIEGETAQAVRRG